MCESGKLMFLLKSGANFRNLLSVKAMNTANFRLPRLALVGCEGYGAQLVKRIISIPHAGSLLAVTSGNPSGLDARRCEETGIKVFTSVDDLLAFSSGRVDAIVNVTPIHIHKSVSIRCLEAGFPVWVEKPPVATLAEMDELLSVSARTGLSVDVGFNTIYSEVAQQLKAELVGGIYGKVERIRSIGAWIRPDSYFERSNWAGKLKIGDSWVYDGTINNPFAHAVCNNLYFAASRQHELAEVETLQARLWHGHDIESEDTSSLRCVTKEGVVLLSHFTLCPEEEIDALTVIDTDKAVITLHDFHVVEIAWRDGRQEVRKNRQENRLDMLENLCSRLYRPSPALCPLAMTRPFTQLVNSAFKHVMDQHNGTIPGVPDKFLERYPHNGSVGTRIRGINACLMRAHESADLMDLGSLTTELDTACV
jgi:predicted dehydrogenase